MKMNRRNVLMGLGSLATLAGGVMGTGAFSKVSATRDAQISVATDANAYLTLDATNSSSALIGQQEENGTIAFDFAGGSVNSSVNPAGAGLNPESTTVVPKAFEVYNHGTETISVKATIPGDGFGNAISTDAEKQAVRDAITFEYVDSATETVYDLLWDGTGSEWVEFGVGKGGWVTVKFELEGTGLSGDLVDQITFTAETNPSQ